MFKILKEECKPQRATKYSSCIDLFAAKDVIIGAGETKSIPLGVKIDLNEFKKLDIFWDQDFEGLKNFRRKDWNEFLKSHQLNLHTRSSMSSKHGLIMANGAEDIELEYPDEIGILLHNPIKIADYGKNESGILHLEVDTRGKVKINKGEKIAQVKLVEHKSYLIDV